MAAVNTRCGIGKGGALSLLILLILSSANAADQPVPIHKTSVPVTVDGKGDEACWEAAEALPFDHFYGVEKPTDRQRSILKMLWDDKNLYLLFECEDQFLTARETKHDGMPFFDDCAEIFLRPTPEPIDMHFAFEINLLKKANDIILLNQLYRGKDVAVKGYNPNYQTAVQLRGTLNDNSDVDEGWTIELAIPLEAFWTAWAIPQIEDGCAWAVMAVRIDRNDVEGKRTSMSTVFPLSADEKVHNPECFRLMRFMGANE